MNYKNTYPFNIIAHYAPNCLEKSSLKSINDTISKLSDKKLLFLKLRFKDNLSFQEIGKRLGATKQYAKIIDYQINTFFSKPKTQNLLTTISMSESNNVVYAQSPTLRSDLEKLRILHEQMSEVFDKTKSNKDLSKVELSNRTYNALVNAGFTNLSELAGKSIDDLSNIKGIGQLSLNELLSVLTKNGIPVH